MEEILKGRAGRYNFSEQARAKSRESFRRNMDERARNLPFHKWSAQRKRDFLMKEQEGKCAGCSLGETWNGKFLYLEMDHIDGNTKNEIRENLRLLCPNCHSQTPTFRISGERKKRVSINITRSNPDRPEDLFSLFAA